ncbi:hypothetical protein NKH77_14550 [Streptomyces sp. M19]
MLDVLGLDDAKLDAKETHGALRVVTAEPVLNDLDTHGWQTGLDVAADGRLVGGHGMLAPVEKGDSYPVIDAAEALKLLNAGGTNGCAATPDAKAEGTAARTGKAGKGTESGGDVAPCGPATVSRRRSTARTSGWRRIWWTASRRSCPRGSSRCSRRARRATRGRSR